MRYVLDLIIENKKEAIRLIELYKEGLEDAISNVDTMKRLIEKKEKELGEIEVAIKQLKGGDNGDNGENG